MTIETVNNTSSVTCDLAGTGSPNVHVTVTQQGRMCSTSFRNRTHGAEYYRAMSKLVRKGALLRKNHAPHLSMHTTGRPLPIC